MSDVFSTPKATVSDATSILVSGTSRGLGKAIAQAYLARGVSVIGLARSESDIVSEQYTHVLCDVSDEVSVKGVFRMIRSQKIAVDRVINGAGLSQTALAMATSGEAARRIMDVNFLGTFLLSKHATRAMMRTGHGRVVTLSSINVPLHSRGGSIYNSSKAACEQLMRTLTSEARGLDITYNALGLSIVADTGMGDGLSDAAVSEKTDRLDKPAALSVEEIVHSLDFLFSPLAAKISGQTLVFGAP